MATPRTNMRFEPEIKEMAMKQAESLGLSLTEYTRMLYKLDLAELVKKAVEKEKKR